MACFGGFNFYADSFSAFIFSINYMGFFGSKNKHEKDALGVEIQKKVEREVIVHNMPRQEKIVGEIVNKNIGSSVSLENDKGFKYSSKLSAQANSKKNFRVMGLIIIFIGFIFIALIVFLTYRFVISPTVDSKYSTGDSQAIKPEIESEESIKTEAQANKDSSIDINQEANDLNEEKVEFIETGDVVDLNDLMQEEFQGQDAITMGPLIDSDGDGLYDEEEILIGTSIFLSDSDGDSYADLSEIKNNYNPSGEGILADSSFISIYRNFNYGFNFLYPKAWELKEVSDNLIVFEDSDSSLIQLAVTENSDGLSILNWYETTFPEELLVHNKLISKTGYEGVISKNGLNIYLTDEARTNIFIFSYIPASPGRLTFINIFEMMYSSISFFQ